MPLKRKTGPKTGDVVASLCFAHSGQIVMVKWHENIKINSEKSDTCFRSYGLNSIVHGQALTFKPTVEFHKFHSNSPHQAYQIETYYLFVSSLYLFGGLAQPESAGRLYL